MFVPNDYTTRHRAASDSQRRSGCVLAFFMLAAGWLCLCAVVYLVTKL